MNRLFCKTLTESYRCTDKEDKEDYWVNCTCPIPLKEVDVNENAKWITKQASTIAEKNNLIAAEQHGKLGGSSLYLASNK